MYQPALFREDRLEVLHQLVREHPFGLLVSAGPGGLLANPLPFLLDVSPAPGVLRCHMARANEHWRELSQVEECLVVFQGPHAYVTPSWYETKRENGRVVPTWNYATVHIWGRPRVMDDVNWLRKQVDALTHSQEDQRPHPWAVDDAPPPFVAAQLRAIVGVEIPIARIEGKWKMSQNRPVADRVAVRDGFLNETPSRADMASLVAERGGLPRSDEPN